MVSERGATSGAIASGGMQRGARQIGEACWMWPALLAMVTARLATTSFMNLQRPLTDAGHAQEAQIPPAVQQVQEAINANRPKVL